MFVGGLSWKIIVGGVLAVAVPSVLIFLSIVMQEGQTLIRIISGAVLWHF